MPVSPSPRLFDAEHRALTLGVALSVSLMAFEAMSVATVLPVAARELGASGGYGWAFSAFMLANLIGAIAAGQRADARGPASPLALALALFGVGLAVAGLSQGWAMLIVGRALQGLGGGAIMTVAYVAIRRGYAERLRARVLAMVSTAWILPSILGPLVGGLLAEHGSWRWVFLGLLPMTILPAALALPTLRRMGAPGPSGVPPTRGRLLASTQLALGTGLLLASLERSWGFAPLGLVGLVLAGSALRRLLPTGTLVARRGLPAGLALRGLLGFIYFGSEAFTPLGLVTLRGLSPTEAGLFLTGAALSWVTGSWIQARMDERDHGSSRRRRVVGGLGLTLIGIATMAVSTLITAIPIALAAAGWVLAGLGMGLGYPTGSEAVLRLAPRGEEGKISSSLNLAEGLGIALGTGICGAALDATQRAGWSPPHGFGLAFAVALLPGALALTAGVRLFAETPGEP